MEEEAITNKEAGKKKKGMKTRTKVFLYALGILLILFILWCILVLTWPGFSPTLETIAYTDPVSGTLIGRNYEDEEVLSHFKLEAKKRKHVHWTSIFSFHYEYHYEHTLISESDTYFYIKSLTVEGHYGEGKTFEFSFTPTQENLKQAYFDVVLLDDVETSSFTYSIKSGSEVTGYMVN